MSVAPAIKQKRDIPFEFRVVDGGLSNEKYNLEESVKYIHSNKPTGKSNKVAGESSEVYAFRTEEEIKAMIDVFDKHIADAPDGDKERIACRNKLLFIIGINIGIRASDLRKLKFNDFLDLNGSFKEFHMFQPEKTRNKKKFVKIYFNDKVQKSLIEYMKMYPVENLDTYIFSSRKGSEPISTVSLWRIIKETALEAGIKQNIGSHSLRKTFGYWRWHKADDKMEALTYLQSCFNHDSPATTMKYIGITDIDIRKLFNSVNLG